MYAFHAPPDQNLPTDDYTKEKIDTCNKEINDKKIEVKQKRKELLSNPNLHMRDDGSW